MIEPKKDIELLCSFQKEIGQLIDESEAFKNPESIKKCIDALENAKFTSGGFVKGSGGIAELLINLCIGELISRCCKAECQ